MKCPAKVRALIACFGLSVLFTVFSSQLIYLQVYKHDEYTALAAEKHVKRQVIYGRRGLIEDINQEVQAQNEPMKTVVADASIITNPPAVAEILARKLKLDRNTLEETLGGKDKYLVLRKRVPETLANEIGDELRAKSLRGILFEEDSTRSYPNGSMLCHVIGFMDFNHRGINGIERSMDQYLRGHDGFRYIEHD